jgi:predicted metal-binding protein
MKLELKEIGTRAGVFEYGIVNPQDVEFLQEVRGYCEENRCRQYGKTWACPPAVGTVEECRERAQQYDKMLVFSGKFDLEDSFDFEGMMAGMQNFKIIAHALEQELAPFYQDHLMLSNEGCGNCETCTYPAQPCRFPDRVHGSIEGYGIFVGKLAEMAGIHYTNGANTVTYFGAFLYRDEDLLSPD